MPGAKTTYSTLEISRICEVDPVTVARWCDRGELKCFRTPGGHRRVPREDLTTFLRRRNIPLPDGMRPHRSRVLVVGAPALAEALKSEARRAEVAAAAGALEAALSAGAEPPSALVLGAGLAGAAELVRALREHPKTAAARVLALGSLEGAEPLPAEADARQVLAALGQKPKE